jgi:hypothetical protein
VLAPSDPDGARAALEQAVPMFDRVRSVRELVEAGRLLDGLG